MSSSPEADRASNKRKRDIVPENEDDKLEIDVTLPEPPSKKAKRKEKKLSKPTSKSPKKADDAAAVASSGSLETEVKEEAENDTKTSANTATPAKRSDHGVWIGNMPFKATKNSVRDFLLNEGGIDANDITRIHLPTSEKGQNRGFAYVDFTTPAVMAIALAMSEKLLLGRAVLIKNAKSFEGRPEKSAAEENAAGNISKKEPSNRVFVGNLSFDMTKDELWEHFGQAGIVEDVFLATFEDSGKCKGFGWVTFADIDAAKAAVRGFVFKDDVDDENIADGEDESPKEKKSKPKKAERWFINRLHGRPLKCEFAEDAQTRYKKRFGKASSQTKTHHQPGYNDAVLQTDDKLQDAPHQVATATEFAPKKKDYQPKRLDKDQRQELRRKKHDARMIAPGKALANTQRATGAIVAGAGSKTTFD